MHRYHGNLVVWDSQVGVIFNDPCSFLYSDVFPAFPLFKIHSKLGGGFKYVFFSPLFGEMIHFG